MISSNILSNIDNNRGKRSLTRLDSLGSSYTERKKRKGSMSYRHHSKSFLPWFKKVEINIPKPANKCGMAAIKNIAQTYARIIVPKRKYKERSKGKYPKFGHIRKPKTLENISYVNWDKNLILARRYLYDDIINE